MVLFDGDDTLWSTMPLYVEAKRLFATKVAHCVSSAKEAIDYLDSVDEANVSSMGFTPRRFSHSLVQSYRELCSRHGVAVDYAVECELLRCAEGISNTSAITMPDAVPVLLRLACRCDLMLMTKGDPEVQERRISDSGLRDYFVGIYVFPGKSEKQFEAVLAEQKCSPDNAWSVGNSVRSDINPALRVGMAAIWIPYVTWRHEEAPLVPQARLFVCESLSAAADVILQETD